jgi:hypothetical protein
LVSLPALAQIEPASTAEQDWQRVQPLLAARDEALQSVWMPWVARTGFEGPGWPSERETGWWALDGERFAFARNYREDRVEGVSLRGQVHYTWDSERCRVSSVLPELLDDRERAEDLYLWPAVLREYDHWAQRELLNTTHLPGEFGLMTRSQRLASWVDILGGSRALGREDVDGVDCLLLQVDRTGPGERDPENGLFSLPSLMWLDDRGSLLVRQRFDYAPYRPEAPHLRELPPLGMDREFEGYSYRLQDTWTLTSVRELGQLSVPTGGILRRSIRRDGIERIEVRVSDEATCNEPVPEPCFDVELPPGTEVIDEARRELWAQMWDKRCRPAVDEQ